MTGDDGNPIHARDGGRCVVHGDRAQTVHHRNHRHRDDRPSNRISVCGSGTTGGHGWIEGNWARANANGWTISRHTAEPAQVWVWYEAGPYGQGFYLLDDEYGFKAWPGSVLHQATYGEEHTADGH